MFFLVGAFGAVFVPFLSLVHLEEVYQQVWYVMESMLTCSVLVTLAVTQLHMRRHGGRMLCVLHLSRADTNSVRFHLSPTFFAFTIFETTPIPVPL